MIFIFKVDLLKTWNYKISFSSNKMKVSSKSRVHVHVCTYKLIMAISNFFISDNVKSKNKQSLVDKILFSVHINHNSLVIYRTCRELRMVNTQANTLDSSVTASRPNTHVIPSKGNNITVAFKTVL